MGGCKGSFKGGGKTEGPAGLWWSQPLGDRAQDRLTREARHALCSSFVMLANRKSMPADCRIP